MWERVGDRTELQHIEPHSICCKLTFDPAKHVIPKTEEVHIPLAWVSLADKMGQGKIPRYSHRLMHRKRVICELHDRYFPLMTIKLHDRYFLLMAIKLAIQRTAAETYPHGQSWGDIEWAIELLYSSVKTGSQWVWRPDQMVRRCWNENMSQRGWAPRPQVEQPRRMRTTHGDVRRGWGGQYVAVFVRFPTPSYTQTLSNKVRGTYFSKRLCRSSSLCRCVLHESAQYNLYNILAITAFLSRSPGLLNRGPGGPSSLGHVPQSSILSPAGLFSNCWLPVFTRVIYWFDAHSSSCECPNRTHSTRPRSRL